MVWCGVYETDQGTDGNSRSRYPPKLLRRYQVLFKPSSQAKASSIRQVDATRIGKLVQIDGIVIRATAVKPSITVATYACDQCGSEIYQEVTGPTFMPRLQCDSSDCVQNRRKGQLHLQTRGSKFEKFQELKIQELAKHVPTGSIPRTMTVHCLGSTSRCAVPGDQIKVSGIFLPVPYSGYRQIRAGLLSDTYLEAQTIEKTKKSHKENILTEENLQEIEELRSEDNIYDRLGNSVAPAIFGHDDVKKALLLLLVSGVDRKMKDGMKIRGDINVCLMGDPGVAKSQMLKAVSELAPRSVYTTGRGSSGVGLTAAITRDPYTGELILEGGALVLADNGVCCIDEFDKMEDSDRTAIHEVMEQQTVSIAKAGITTQLNARAAILAAANPLYGRYDMRKSAAKNINLPPSLLSRFDLLFLLLDRPNVQSDLRLANHITYVHQHNDYPPITNGEPINKNLLRQYIAEARRFDPYISPDLHETITGMYVNMREDSQSGGKDDTFTSPRTLLAMLRISTALARIRMSNEVLESDVEEAARLMHESKASLYDEDEQDSSGKDENPIFKIFDILNLALRNKDKQSMRTTEARGMVTSKGFTMEEFEEFLQHYEDQDIISLDDKRQRIYMEDSVNA